MKRIFPAWLAACAAIMLLLPWLCLTLFPANGDMGLILLLFFCVNPLFSAAEGFFAGRDVRKRWPLILIAPALFVAGAWLLLDMGNPDFLLYAAAYLVIGVCAMLLRTGIRCLLRR